MTTICITPHDPLIVRDARPFDVGGNVYCLEWPYPSLAAGTLRTVLGKKIADPNITKPFDDDTLLNRIKGIKFSGPILIAGRQPFFLAPRDILFYKKEENKTEQTIKLRPAPLKEGEGCNLPNPNLWPIEITDDYKPAKTPAFWSKAKMIAWLQEDSPANFELPNEDKVNNENFISGFEKEYRTNVKIEASTFLSEDSMLFTTEGLSISAVDIDQNNWHHRHLATTIATRVESNDEEINKSISNLTELHPFGGERRLAEIKAVEDAEIWNCPKEIEESLSHAKAIRMVLATPAIFKKGWLPGWLDTETLKGILPQSTVQVQLRGACVERWRPISGWSLEKGKKGPKPIRRLVTAGSVYFFEIISGDPQEIAKVWLQSVSDTEQNDGFGLAIWGVWNPQEK